MRSFQYPMIGNIKMADAQTSEMGKWSVSIDDVVARDDVITGDVRLSRYKSRTVGRTFITFGVELMPPEATPKPHIFTFLQPVIPTWRTLKLAKLEDDSTRWF
jgi:hypothetical protein